MKIALSVNGLYVSAQGGGDNAGRVEINRTAIGPWEIFTVYQLGDGFVALETEKGRFLSHVPSSGLIANRTRHNAGNDVLPYLRTVPNGVVSLPHDAWESFFGVTLSDTYAITVVEADPPVKPPKPTRPVLRVSGFDFVDETGKRIVLNGMDAFSDYRRWLDGREGALDPLMKEANDFGFNVRRVFLQGAASENNVLELRPAQEPEWRSQLRPFVEYQNSHGIIPLMTLGVDNQVVGSDLISLWNIMHEELRGSVYLASGGNEHQKNGFDPQAYPNPGPSVIWSRGSDIADQVTPPNGATAAEFHQRTDPVGMLDAVASVKFMREHGYGMLWMDEPRGYDEIAQGDKRSNDPKTAWTYARLYSTLWALAVFHNTAGISSRLMGPRTGECAAAWCDGMRI